ncbi:MAG: family 78 glycoside hydrolase catalytic domain [Lachnospiraceae bacterium]|nr:family 78 glycoside hydrolase catalytic domain [Lachnospiraceae bacterium]
MKAIRLKTEYLSNPIGIDYKAPRLFWNCQGGRKQSAYQIVAGDEKGKLLWDSGKVESCAMRSQWGGGPVPYKTRVLWKIRLWDEKGTPGDWAEGGFETGIDSWQAKWITGNYKVNKKRRYPVDCFRRKFVSSDIAKARLYITACGLYEARMNGVRIGVFILAPGITDYRKRVQYQTYDVTELLREGENTLTVQLADGWYRGSCGAWGLKNQYGTETKLLAQLEITRSDGSVQIIATDESWEWSNDGPIRFADNKDGEVVDAARVPGYTDRAKITSHPVIPTASDNVAVTEQERLKPKRITTPSGRTVLDFGQNIAGYAEFTVTARAGQRIFLRFGELLDENGEFTQKNIQCSNKKITTPLQQVEYICSDGENHYKTTFAIFGFQYVLVETDVVFQPEDFTAVAVYSDMERTGWFESSNDLLNKLVENTVWSARNNHADLPTDCPTRERHGWAGDAQIFCSTASFLFNYEPMAEKFLNDMYDWQRKNGCLPQIAPEGGVDSYMKWMNGSVGWADAGVIMPYTLWKQYGDRSILERRYDGMKRYAEFMMSRCGKWGGPFARRVGIRGDAKRYLVNRGQAYDEWAEPQDIYVMHFMDFAGPHPEVSTAYTAYICALMAEIAECLGKNEDVPRYIQYRDGCRAAYQAMVKTEKFTLDTDRQARLVRPLAFDLLDEDQTAFARRRLIQALEHYNWRLGTGFLSTPLILDVLMEIDPEAAYRLLENEEIPGWLSMPKNGATTIWESWEGDKAKGSGVASLDHYSKGAVCRWLFDTMCGIRVDGENHFTVAPHPGGHFTYARAVYDSIYGRVESGWEKSGGSVVYSITVPVNCTARVILPDGSVREQEPGTEVYEIWEVTNEDR